MRFLAAQAAGAAAVIGDGDDGGEISDGVLAAGVFRRCGGQRVP